METDSERLQNLNDETVQEKRKSLDAERRKAYDEWMREDEAIEWEMHEKKKAAYDKFNATAKRIDKEITALYWRK